MTYDPAKSYSNIDEHGATTRQVAERVLDNMHPESHARIALWLTRGQLEHMLNKMPDVFPNVEAIEDGGFDCVKAQQDYEAKERAKIELAAHEASKNDPNSPYHPDAHPKALTLNAEIEAAQANKLVAKEAASE